MSNLYLAFNPLEKNSTRFNTSSDALNKRKAARVQKLIKDSRSFNRRPVEDRVEKVVGDLLERTAALKEAAKSTTEVKQVATGT